MHYKMKMEAKILILVLSCMSVNCKPNTSPSCIPGEEPGINNECVPCKKDFYSKDGEKCLVCTRCHHGQNMVHECLSTRNAYCTCPNGQYADGDLCKICSECHPGNILLLECSHNLDTKCGECPKGMTTNETNSKKCHPESKFPKVITNNHYNIVSSSNDQTKIILTCVGIFICVLAIVAFVIYWRRKSINCRQLENHPLKTTVRGNEEALQGASIREEHIQMIPTPKENNKKIDVITADIFEEIGAILNVNKAWVKLAGKLGFNQRNVKRFENDLMNATQEIIYEYSTKQGATVYKLYMALVSIKEHEAASLLEHHLEYVME